FFLFNNRLEKIQITMYIVMTVILDFLIIVLIFYNCFFLIEGSDHNTRRQKRRRPTDSGQNDEYEQKRTFSSLSLSNPSNRVSTTSTDPSRRLSISSTPSISLSSSEDEPASSIHHLGTNRNKTIITDANIQLPPPPISIDQSQQRKRHQRKPTRQKLIQSLNG